MEEDYSIDWEVRIGNGRQLLQAASTIPVHRDTFREHNFTFTGVQTSRSTLSFNVFDESGDPTNNMSSFTCIAQQGPVRLPGNETVVIFYRK